MHAPILHTSHTNMRHTFPHLPFCVRCHQVWSNTPALVAGSGLGAQCVSFYVGAGTGCAYMCEYCANALVRMPLPADMIFVVATEKPFTSHPYHSNVLQGTNNYYFTDGACMALLDISFAVMPVLTHIFQCISMSMVQTTGVCKYYPGGCQGSPQQSTSDTYHDNEMVLILTLFPSLHTFAGQYTCCRGG